MNNLISFILTALSMRRKEDFMKKKSLTCLATGLLTAGLIAGTVLASSADAADENGLSISIQTDKDSYSNGDSISASLSITNDSSYTFKDISYSIAFPENVTPGTDQITSGTLSTLAAGSNRTYTLSSSELSGFANGDGSTTETTVSGDGSSETTKVTPEESTTSSDSSTQTTTSSDPTTQTGDKAPIAILIGLAIVAMVLFLFSFGKKKKKDSVALFLILCLTASGIAISPVSSADAAVPTNSNFSNTVKKTITIEGVSMDITATVTVGSESISNIGIHDPSVFQDPVSGEYYSYGSHIIAGNSDDLVSWKYISGSSAGYGTSNKLFTNNYKTEFAEVYEWLGADVNEGIWALDVTYSEKAAAAGNDPYLMYVTVVNGSWKSAICLATASSPEGPFSYKGMIVCSDFRQSEVENGYTNLLDVLGVSSVSQIPAEQQSYYFTADTTAYKNSLPDCIDPAPYYDGDGNLYLTYGSFTCKGGLRVLKLDSATGLRGDDSYAFDSNGNMDPYFGKKIANSNGEGPYVLTVESSQSSTGYYYFLFWSQGNLRSTGGYNMRMFRSEYPDHGFVDYNGQSAMDNISAANLGVRIMDGFQFTSMPYPSTANGGNSAIVTDEGKIFVHYHSKSSTTTAYGPEGFIIKSNQMFLNEDGWLVTAPYSYAGETMSSLSASEVAGDYEFIYHRLAYYKDPTNVSDNYVSSELVTLNSDGSVSGDHTGSWTLNDNYLTITIDGKEYKGVVLKQYDESADRTETIVFTAEGTDNRTVWGSKVYYSDKERTEKDMSLVSVNGTATEDFQIPVSGLFNSHIRWTSDNSAIVIDGTTAKVICQDNEQTVTLTATCTYGDASTSAAFKVTVPGEEFNIPTTISTSTIDLPTSTAAGKTISWTSSDPAIINVETGEVNVPSNTAKTVTLTGRISGSDRVLTHVITVMPLPANIVYAENFDAMTSIDASSNANLWYSANAASSVTLISKDENDKFVQFAPGRSNSRGAISTFPATGQVSGIYILDFDLKLASGDDQTTEFAVTTENMAYLDKNMNNGIASGYLFKLSANKSSEQWAINDGDTFALAKDAWAHVSALVDTDSGKVALTITDGDATLYSGTVNANTVGSLKGFYVRGGRYNSVTAVDNITIKAN